MNPLHLAAVTTPSLDAYESALVLTDQMLESGEIEPAGPWGYGDGMSERVRERNVARALVRAWESLASFVRVQLYEEDNCTALSLAPPFLDAEGEWRIWIRDMRTKHSVVNGRPLVIITYRILEGDLAGREFIHAIRNYDSATAPRFLDRESEQVLQTISEYGGYGECFLRTRRIRYLRRGDTFLQCTFSWDRRADYQLSPSRELLQPVDRR